MNIVVTDGYTLNSGDLSWDSLAQFGTLQLYDRTPPPLIVERCRDAAIIVTNKTPLSRETLSQLPNAKCICVTATGYNVIDTDAATENGIVVCNVPGYGTLSVAQHVFALLLELTNAVGRHHVSVQRGDWHRSADWCYTVQPVMELSGKTFGIVGYGNIGQAVGRIAAAFDMRVIYFSPSEKQTTAGEPRSLEAVFAESDVVSLHCPLTPTNKGMVNKTLLQKMKPSAFLLNTARGPLIKEEDLANALNSGVIAGAALDVLSTEPPVENQTALLHARNCIVTPHIAWMSREARQRIMRITENNIRAFLQGVPINQVNERR